VFGVADAEATSLENAGAQVGTVFGSFIHLLDQEK
jgi:hypothetical protein